MFPTFPIFSGFGLGHDLSGQAVSLLQDGKQYSSVANALRAVGTKEYARRFSAVP